MRRLNSCIIFVALALTACSADPYQGLYQGVKMHNEMNKTPEERATSPQAPSYDQYKKERDSVINGDTSKTAGQ